MRIFLWPERMGLGTNPIFQNDQWTKWTNFSPKKVGQNKKSAICLLEIVYFNICSVLVPSKFFWKSDLSFISVFLISGQYWNKWQGKLTSDCDPISKRLDIYFLLTKKDNFRLDKCLVGNDWSEKKFKSYFILAYLTVIALFRFTSGFPDNFCHLTLLKSRWFLVKLLDYALKANNFPKILFSSPVIREKIGTC